MKRLLSIVGAVLLLAAGPASADITYTFNGVTFDDGGTLNGTFTTNDAISSLLDYNITSSGGSLGGFTYTPLTAPVDFSALPFILVVETASNNPLLQITFSGLMATGGLITIGTFDSFEQIGTGRREVTAGQVTAGTNTVPEPSTTLLLAISAMGLLVAARRRRPR